jgi:hypothetical protein
MTELAYQILKQYKKDIETEQCKPGKEKWRKEHKEQLNENRRKRYHSDPLVRAKAIFKANERYEMQHHIDYYNPLTPVLAKFAYYDALEKGTRTIHKKELSEHDKEVAKAYSRGHRKRMTEADREKEREIHRIQYEIDRHDPVFIVLERFRNSDRKEQAKERHFIKTVISWYDPMKPVYEKFRYADAKSRMIREGKVDEDKARRKKRRDELKEQKKNLPFITHLTLDQLNIINELKNQDIIGNYSVENQQELLVAEPIVSGCDARGGIQRLWKSHPGAYRKRMLKFARGDMQ